MPDGHKGPLLWTDPVAHPPSRGSRPDLRPGHHGGTGKTRVQSLLVPPSSVVTTNERQFVIRIEKGVAEWVTVSRGDLAGDLVEIFGALRPGDVIVRHGTDELRPGTLIR